MKIATWNVRGFGAEGKKNMVKSVDFRVQDTRRG